MIPLDTHSTAKLPLLTILKKFKLYFIETNWNSAFTGSFAGNAFWCQQFILRLNKTLRGGESIVHHDTTDNCRLYVTKIKTKKIQDDIPSILIDKFKDHCVLVSHLTSMLDATEHCHYPELVREPLRLELCLSSPLMNVTEIIVLGERMSFVAVDKLGVVGKNLWNG